MRIGLATSLIVLMLTPAPPPAMASQTAPMLVYSYVNGGRSRVVTLDPATGESTVRADSAHRLNALAWSGATGRLYYGNVAKNGQGGYATFEVDSLPDANGGASKVDLPDWTDDLDLSVDGRTYVYYASFQGQQLWTVDVATGSRSRITGAGGRLPRWSLDGTAITFTRVVGGNSDVYVWSRETGIRRITASAARDESAAFSPDGRRLLFTRYDAHGHAHVMAVGVDGASLRDVGLGRAQDWSSTGWIAYLTDTAPAQVALRSPGIPGSTRMLTAQGVPVTAIRFRR